MCAPAAQQERDPAMQQECLTDVVHKCTLAVLKLS